MIDLINQHGKNRPESLRAENQIRQALLNEYESLRVIDGNLYREYLDENNDVIHQFVVSKLDVKNVLASCHDSVTSGHLGIAKTKKRILSRFYWPSLKKDVENYVRSCETCQKIKPGVTRTAPLQPIQPTAPLKIVTVDVIGPLPLTEKGNQFALNICDHFTKFVVSYPLPDQQAITIANSIIDYISKFGIPESILSDRGTNFKSEVLNDIYELLDIIPRFTSPFHPQSDGLTERFNQTLKNMLIAYINSSQNDWDEYLSRLCLAYNTAEQSTTGYTPYQLMFGRKPKLAIDLWFQKDASHVEENEVSINYNEFAADLQSSLQDAFKRVSESRDLKMNKAKLIYDRQIRSPNFEIGDRVLVLDSASKVGRNKKLSHRWEGPYKILSKINDTNYRIQKIGNKRKIVIHRNRLKRFFGPKEEVYLDAKPKMKNQSTSTRGLSSLNKIDHHQQSQSKHVTEIPQNTHLNSRRSTRLRKPVQRYGY